MEKQTRLTRSQVIARLREHASAHGFVSSSSLDAYDKLVLRSIPLHFPGLAAARYVAGVPGPPYQKPRRKTGPKPNSKPARARQRMWSRLRVLEELRRIDGAGHSTALQDLLAARQAGLLRAAQLHAGGLRRARRAAGIKRRVVAPLRGTRGPRRLLSPRSGHGFVKPDHWRQRESRRVCMAQHDDTTAAGALLSPPQASTRHRYVSQRRSTRRL